MSVLGGYKTYLGAAGLFGLALYQLSQGDYQAAFESLGQAIVAAGLRGALK